MGAVTRLRDKLTQGNAVGGRIAAIRQVLIEKQCWEHVETRYLDGRPTPVRMPDVSIEVEATRTPSEDLFTLRVSPRMLTKVLGLQREFASALNVRHVNLRQRGSAVLIGVPLNAEQRQSIGWESAYRLKAIPDGCLLLGVGSEDGDETQVCLNIASDANAHSGIIAMTGYGKTNLLQSIVLSAFSAGIKVALFDIRRGLWPLSGHPLVWRHGLFATVETCAAGLECIARRIANGKSAKLLLVIDELPELMRRSPGARDALQSIVLTGRQAGIRTIMGLQQPASVPIPVWANVPVRIVGHVSDPQSAYNASGIPGTDAQRLGQGDFMVVQAGSIVSRFRAPLVTDDELRRFTAKYTPRLADSPTPLGVSVQENVIMSSVGGSEPDEIPAEFLAAIRVENGRSKKGVSVNRIRTMWLERYDKQLNFHKAKRAKELALGA